MLPISYVFLPAFDQDNFDRGIRYWQQKDRGKKTDRFNHLRDLHSPTSALTGHGAGVGCGCEADSRDDGGGVGGVWKESA